MRYLYKVSLSLKFPKFRAATALQRCKLSMRRGVARLYAVYCVVAVPFIFSSTISKV